jgi:hypothetical protein
MQDLSWLISYAMENDYKLTGGELYRTEQQHNWNKKKGLTQVSRSKHQDRLAIDVNLFIDGKLITDKEHPAWQDLGEYWEGMSKHNVWGGRWKSINDPYHFERNV